MANPSLQGVVMDDTRYTATVQVHRVTTKTEPRNPSGSHRETTEVANVVIRAKTLESLKTKVAAHV